MKENESAERRLEKKGQQKGENTGMSCVYFINKQSKSAWRRAIPVSNSQIKQALIKASLSLAILQITFTYFISWTHTFLTKMQTKYNPMLHFHSNNQGLLSMITFLSISSYQRETARVRVAFNMHDHVNRSPRPNYGDGAEKHAATKSTASLTQVCFNRCTIDAST